MSNTKKIYLQSKGVKLNSDDLIKLFSKAPKNKRNWKMMKRSYADIFMDQPDIMLIKSILLTTGMKGNLNDDIILNEDVMDRLFTIPLKPFNMDHNSNNIIGVMADAFLLDENHEEIENEENLPNSVHIGNTAAIWKFACPEEASKLLNEDFYVSMEIWFSRYDYSWGNRIIARNEQTAEILDPHLRIRGGTGSLNGERVKRVVRDLTVGGVSAVKNPANPESVILEIASKAMSKISADMSLDEIEDKVCKDIPAEITENKQNYTRFLDVCREISDEKSQIRHEIMNFDKILAKYTIKIEDNCVKPIKESNFEVISMPTGEENKVNAEVISLKDTIKNLEAELKNKTDEVTKLQSEVASVIKDRDEIKAKFDQIKLDQKLESRRKMLAELKLKDEQITKEIKKTSTFNDETFASHVQDLKDLLDTRVEKVEEDPVLNDAVNETIKDLIEVETPNKEPVLASKASASKESDEDKHLASLMRKIVFENSQGGK